VERGAEAVIRDMASLARKAVEESGKSLDDIQSIGVGIPGIHDNARGIVPMCTNLYWHEVPLIAINAKAHRQARVRRQRRDHRRPCRAVAGVSSPSKIPYSSRSAQASAAAWC
jgi:hypothetical protein